MTIQLTFLKRLYNKIKNILVNSKLDFNEYEFIIIYYLEKNRDCIYKFEEKYGYHPNIAWIPLFEGEKILEELRNSLSKDKDDGVEPLF